jgi:hypothetical protein
MTLDGSLSPRSAKRPSECSIDHPLLRRRFLTRGAMGLGAAAWASLQHPSSLSATQAPRLAGAPRAKRAIFLFMAGGPSQLDMWDYKPQLANWDQRELPASIRQQQRLTTMTSGRGQLLIAPSPFRFQQSGQSGTWVSELLPALAKQVDRMAIVRSMSTEAINHDPALTYICTGNQLPGHPSLGAWLSYGLGTENADLPAFVVMTARWSSSVAAQAIYSRQWGSGFLPSEYQGVLWRSEGDPVLYLSDPTGADRAGRRSMLDSLQRLNLRHQSQHGDPETLARIEQYELAFRMQASVPALADLQDEPAHAIDLYGPDARQPGSFANCCLKARRLLEHGVRFVQIFHRGWDQHSQLRNTLPLQCGDIDQPSAALIEDLAQRGLLDDTLVIWGGEFGRTVYSQIDRQAEGFGRDHHPRCFTAWLAGGGVRGGTVHGETDEFGYNTIRDPVHVRDLNATILHCLGLNHEELTFPFQGLDQRLTGVTDPASVVESILR